MAATRIIKLKATFPPYEEEKKEPAEDPRAELIQRLLEYQSYKESSGFLRNGKRYGKTPEEMPEEDFTFEPEPLLFEANVFDLMTAFKKLLETAPGRGPRDNEGDADCGG